MLGRRELIVVALAGVGLTAYLLIRAASRSPSAPPPQAQARTTNEPARLARLAMRHQTALAAEPDPLAQPTNRLARFISEQGVPDVRPEKLTDYLQANHRSADSLLGAYRTTRDPAFLHEALEKFPNDPRLHFDAVFFGPAEDRRKWLDAFKQSAPDNPLPYYISAQDYFKAGQPGQAVQELVHAEAKPAYQDYSFDFMQNAEEAYRAAGYSDAEAKAAATSQLLLPQLAGFKQTARSLIDLAKSYRQSGDDASAQAAFQMALGFGQRLDQPGTLTLIQSLVGVAIQRMALDRLDPSASLGDSGQTVQNRLDALNAQRQAVKGAVARVDAVLPTLSDQELGNYFDRMRYFGERKAMDWLLDKYGRQQ